MIKITKQHTKWIDWVLSEEIEPDYYDFINHHKFWVGWDDNTRTSVSSAIILDNTTLYLSSTVVLEDHRGNGLQLDHIKARLKWAKSQGCTTAITYTLYSNVPSINNLIDAGFKRYIPEDNWSEIPCAYWKREI